LRHPAAKPGNQGGKTMLEFLIEFFEAGPRTGRAAALHDVAVDHVSQWSKEQLDSVVAALKAERNSAWREFENLGWEASFRR
jgi:hypothetical protein